MSWDILVLNYEGSPPDMEEMGAGEREPKALGNAARVRRAIAKHLPEIDWSTPGFGLYEGEGFSIEFSLGDDEPVESIMLHARGEGDGVAAAFTFAAASKWSLYDMSTDEFLDPDSPSLEGWEGFQAFRDEAVAVGGGKHRRSARKKK